MRIHLIGRGTESIDSGNQSPGTVLTPQALADTRICVFDAGHGFHRHERLPGWPGERPDAAGTLIPCSDGNWLTILRGLPGRLQSLVPRLTQAAVVAVRTDVLLEVLPLGETEDPVQDALIRLFVQNPGTRFEISDERLQTPCAVGAFPNLVPGMTPGAPPDMQQQLARFAAEELGPVQSAADAVALTAGLFQMHDCLDRSHSLSQDVEGEGRHAAGDYWHAIMHRREPDYGNSKYWFRRVGRHPVFDDLAQWASDEFDASNEPETRGWSDRVCGGGKWDPFVWVDLCQEAAHEEGSPLYRIAQRIQWIEMLLLLRQTAHDAYGTN